MTVDVYQSAAIGLRGIHIDITAFSNGLVNDSVFSIISFCVTAFSNGLIRFSARLVAIPVFRDGLVTLGHGLITVVGFGFQVVTDRIVSTGIVGTGIHINGGVIPWSRQNGVRPSATHHNIVTGTGDHDIIARSAEQGVVTTAGTHDRRQIGIID